MHEYGFFLIYGCKEQFEKKTQQGQCISEKGPVLHILYNCWNLLVPLPQSI